MYENVNPSELQIAPFKATHILRPDLLSLAVSLSEYGVLSPLIVQKATNIVIDGNERLLLVSQQKNINEAVNNLVPVKFVDCDSIEAMMMHISINRSRGAILAKPMSKIVRDMVLSGKYSEKDLSRLLSIKKDEYELMMDGTLLKQRKISEHKYSRAWVPVEAPPGTIDAGMSFEVPPNPDR